jgi:hypothetical protein
MKQNISYAIAYYFGLRYSIAVFVAKKESEIRIQLNGSTVTIVSLFHFTHFFVTEAFITKNECIIGV